MSEKDRRAAAACLRSLESEFDTPIGGPERLNQGRLMNWLRTCRMLLLGAMKAPSPRDVAWAIAAGTAVGLVPKGNLLALGLGIVMCSVRLNLPVALATAVFVSVIAPIADPLFDMVGGALLTTEALRPMWVWVAERPYSAWTQFNHTVVLGAFVIALVQVYPTYRLTRPASEKLLPKVIERLRRSRVMRWWARAEWSTRLTSAHGG